MKSRKSAVSAAAAEIHCHNGRPSIIIHSQSS